MNTTISSLPAGWPTIADVYYHWIGPLGTEFDYTVDDQDGTRFLVNDCAVATVPLGTSQETVDLVRDAIRNTVEHIGQFAIRPFPDQETTP